MLQPPGSVLYFQALKQFQHSIPICGHHRGRRDTAALRCNLQPLTLTARDRNRMCLSEGKRRRQYMPLLAVQTPLHFYGVTSRLMTPQSLSITIACLACSLKPCSCAKCLRNRPVAAWSTQLFLQRTERKFQNPGVVPSVLPPAVQAISICDTLARYNGVLVLRLEPVQVVSSRLGAPWTLALCKKIC